MKRRELLALGGVIGPAMFVGAWTLNGLNTPGFSSGQSAISDLAAVDASTPSRIAMTVGFVGFGLGSIAFGSALRGTLEGRAWMAAIADGRRTVGVAATPLGGWAGDGAHATFAGLGYATLVALPLLAVKPFARRDRSSWAKGSAAIAAISAVSLVVSTLGPAHGFWQRLGLTTGDVWIVATAAAIVAGAIQPRSGDL